MDKANKIEESAFTTSSKKKGSAAVLHKKGKKYIRLTFKLKLVACCAFILTGIFRLSILVVPFRYIAALMGKETMETPEFASSRDISIASKVRFIVDMVGRHTPWESKCLVKALTARTFLKLFHIQNTLYLGMAKDDKGKLIAHAWLRCGNTIVTGGKEAGMFKAVTYFSSKAHTNPPI